jgi:hypothetical protein
MQWLLLIGLWLSVALPAHALPAADATACLREFSAVEARNGIPRALLASVATVESGRWNDELRRRTPWPWTIGASGKGYYLNSKQEAIAKAKELIRSGVRNMDLGCMQVNLMHHPKAFRSLSEAFEPRTNVAYAAKFLMQNYDESRSWRKAVSYYHSRTPHLGAAYVQRVAVAWRQNLGQPPLKPSELRRYQTASLAPRESSQRAPLRRKGHDMVIYRVEGESVERTSAGQESEAETETEIAQTADTVEEPPVKSRSRSKPIVTASAQSGEPGRYFPLPPRNGRARPLAKMVFTN